MNEESERNYRIILKSGQEITVKGRASCRDFGIGCLEIYKDEDREEPTARFELSEIAGVIFDTEEGETE